MVPPKSPGGTKDLKTTTIVMSKHTLAPQNPNNVSNIMHLIYNLYFSFIIRYVSYIFQILTYKFENICMCSISYM